MRLQLLRLLRECDDLLLIARGLRLLCLHHDGFEPIDTRLDARIDPDHRSPDRIRGALLLLHDRLILQGLLLYRLQLALNLIDLLQPFLYFRGRPRLLLRVQCDGSGCEREQEGDPCA